MVVATLNSPGGQNCASSTGGLNPSAPPFGGIGKTWNEETGNENGTCTHAHVSLQLHDWGGRSVLACTCK